MGLVGGGDRQKKNGDTELRRRVNFLQKGGTKNSFAWERKKKSVNVE